MQSLIQISKNISINLDANKIGIYISGEKYIDYSLSKINDIIQKAKYLKNIIINPDLIQNILKTNHNNGELLLSFYKLLDFWIKNKYNTKLFDYQISLPILNKLVQIGDRQAKKVFHEEILRHLWGGDPSANKFLERNNYYKYVLFNSYKRRINFPASPKDIKITLLIFTILVVIFAIIPYFSAFEILALSPIKIRDDLEFWRLFTSIFVHQHRIYLIINLSLFLIFGCLYEVNIKFPSWTYLILFILSAIIGNVFQVFLTDDPNRMLSGASGGIFGTMGALSITFLVKRKYFFSLIVDLFFGSFLIVSAHPSVAFYAHFFGFLSGAAINSLFYILDFLRHRNYMITIDVPCMDI